MMENHFFPSSSREALVMLYLQNQDLTGKSPAEIQQMYYAAYAELTKDYRENKKNYAAMCKSDWQF